MTQTMPEIKSSESSDCSYNGTETAVSEWHERFPAASRVYWIVRSALAETDKKNKSHHHRVAVLAIHDSFPSKPERARLGLPATALELAGLLGVSDRVLRKYKGRYPAIFSATRQTLRDSFLGEYYGRVYEAMGETAVIVGKEGNSDRRLFLQVVGDLGPSGDEESPLHTVGMTLDEWRAESERRRQQAAKTAALFEETEPDVAAKD